jgi:hypothetical protein
MDVVRSFGIGSISMTDSLHDTIDLKDDLEDLDLVGEMGAGATAAGEASSASEPVAGSPPGIVELILVSAANAIWAVVGLVIWLPQATRAVLEATLRTAHAALTHQPSARVVAGIQQVSRSYTERFLGRHGDPVLFGRRQELRPLRLVGETAWTVAFYLVVLRWLAPQIFGPLWERLSGATKGAAAAVADAGGRFFDRLVPDLASLDANGLQVGGTLLGVAFVGLALGFWLGRRER